MKKKKLIGVLRCHPRGFGFVHPDKGEDIFIPKKLMGEGVEGDRVEIELEETSPKGPAGKIIAIIERGMSHIAGTVYSKGAAGYLVYSSILGAEKNVIVKSKKKLVKGDRIVARIVRWSETQDEVECELEKFLGRISDPSIDIVACLEEFQLSGSFSTQALSEAQKIEKHFGSKDLIGRVDLTSLDCLTIDPCSAGDFDDALSLTKDKKGNFHLGVHIADVAHFVKEGSELDKEAFLRGNSVYFPGMSIPMLPDSLSSNLCSLRPNVERLVISVMMDFDKKGELYNYEIKRSFIKSKRRFTYEEVASILNKREKDPLENILQNMGELGQLLKENRQKRGSVDLSLTSGELEVDEKGDPLAFKVVEYDISHQLVEEFMLKANEIIAIHLSKSGKSLIYRVHEEPTSINVQDFYDFARALKFELPESPTHKDLQELFCRAKNTPYAHQLSMQFIRSMKIAIYSAENMGHYGLALENYCHFTSPIRRYSDLVAERLLFDEEGKNIDIAQIASICSDKERISIRAEGRVTLLKKLRLLQKFAVQDPNRCFRAVITKIKPYGFSFEVVDLFIEGSLHVRDLRSDFFAYESNKLRLKGRRTRRAFTFGDEILVKIREIDLILLETHWEIVDQVKRKR